MGKTFEFFFFSLFLSPNVSNPAIELARTEVEMANVISMREAASANLAAAKYLGLPIVEQD